jgi:hypothetical protein
MTVHATFPDCTSNQPGPAESIGLADVLAGAYDGDDIPSMAASIIAHGASRFLAREIISKLFCLAHLGGEARALDKAFVRALVRILLAYEEGSL